MTPAVQTPDRPAAHSPAPDAPLTGEAGLHLLVPWAACLSPACEEALPALDALVKAGRLPHLQTLLSRLTSATWLKSDEYALHVPHEVLWSQAQGWQQTPAQPLVVPTGAWLAHQAGLLTDATTQNHATAWGLITPCHWAMGHDSLTMMPPDDLQLANDDSRALFEAARPWFESEGWSLYWVSAFQWLACHPSLSDLPTASLDRVVGRNPDVWLPSDARTRLVRRLQAEVQMLWYQHPVNGQREATGLPAVNSFWLSGCGAWPDTAGTRTHDAAPPMALRMDHGLQHALMRMDIPAWLAAWEALDAGLLAEGDQALSQGRPVQLSLCGERHAMTLSAPPHSSVWQSLVQRFRRTPTQQLSTLLQSL